jgi:hypothetical protein
MNRKLIDSMVQNLLKSPFLTASLKSSLVAVIIRISTAISLLLPTGLFFLSCRARKAVFDSRMKDFYFV